MSSRVYVLCAIACIACTANAAEKECRGNDCNLTVTVNSCDNIVVEPDGLSTDHPVNLRWDIVTPGYEFVADTGIEFSDPQFVVKNAPHPNQFHVHDKKSSTGRFDYRVNIEGCASADPYVRNN
jgi:hypothetical protein